jgi:hypothetical protein
LRWISVCGHAIVSTPVGSVVSVAAPESSSGNFPTDGGLPQPISGSAPTLNFSRIAQRSLALRPACSLNRHAAHVSRRLRRLCRLHRRSDSYRLERPSCRAGIAPAEDPRLVTAHNWVRSRRDARLRRCPAPSIGVGFVRPRDPPNQARTEGGSTSQVVNLKSFTIHHRLPRRVGDLASFVAKTNGIRASTERGRQVGNWVRSLKKWSLVDRRSGSSHVEREGRPGDRWVRSRRFPRRPRLSIRLPKTSGSAAPRPSQFECTIDPRRSRKEVGNQWDRS